MLSSFFEHYDDIRRYIELAVWAVLLIFAVRTLFLFVLGVLRKRRWLFASHGGDDPLADTTNTTVAIVQALGMHSDNDEVFALAKRCWHVVGDKKMPRDVFLSSLESSVAQCDSAKTVCRCLQAFLEQHASGIAHAARVRQQQHWAAHFAAAQQHEQQQQQIAAAAAAAAAIVPPENDVRPQLLEAFEFNGNTRPKAWSLDTPIEQWKEIWLWWPHSELAGKVRRIYLTLAAVVGSVRWELLPTTLDKLDLSYNRFASPVGWLHLPRLSNLTELNLSSNKFTGTVEWVHLPRTLSDLHLQHNVFSGTVDWAQLPRSLTLLDLTDNQFTGTVDWAQLPRSLLGLDLRKNKFTGVIDCALLPPRVSSSLGINLFTGIANWPQQGGFHRIIWHDFTKEDCKRLKLRHTGSTYSSVDEADGDWQSLVADHSEVGTHPAVLRSANSDDGGGTASSYDESIIMQSSISGANSIAGVSVVGDVVSNNASAAATVFGDDDGDVDDADG